MFTEERFTPDNIDEMDPLTVDHIGEVGPFQFEFKIDWDRYVLLESMGSIRLFVARVGGQMVGYSVYVIATHTHFANTVFASQDALYIVPDHRGKGMGARFIRFCEEQLADVCDAITQAVTPEVDFSENLLKCGYVPLENLYVKNLARIN